MHASFKSDVLKYQNNMNLHAFKIDGDFCRISLDPVPRFTGKTQITGKTAEIPEKPKNNREILIGASAITFIY